MALHGTVAKLKSKMKDGPLSTKEAATFYRAQYVLAVAREADSERLEPQVREKYRNAMRWMLRYDTPHFRPEPKRVFAAWIKCLRIPDDSVSRHLAQLVSYSLKSGFGRNSIEPEKWETAILDLLQRVLNPWATSSEVGGLRFHLTALERQQSLDRVVNGAVRERLHRCFEIVRFSNQQKTPENAIWGFDESTEVHVLNPPVYHPGMGHTGYLSVVEAYIEAVDFVVMERGKAAPSQAKLNLERDMRWLAWKGVEGLTDLEILIRHEGEDVTRDPRAWQGIDNVLDKNGKTLGVGRLAGLTVYSE
jgi:hypothetical protein